MIDDSDVPPPSPRPRPLLGRRNVISDDVRIGEGTRLGNFALIRDSTVIGRGCTIGSYVDIEGDVRIGSYVSVQSGRDLTRGALRGGADRAPHASGDSGGARAGRRRVPPRVPAASAGRSRWRWLPARRDLEDEIQSLRSKLAAFVEGGSAA